MAELSRIVAPPTRIHPDFITRAAGYAIMLAALATALLPAGNFERGPAIVGSLLVVVGFLETVANSLRAKGKSSAMAAGAVSIAAGILIFVQPVATFVTTVYVVIGWLAIRALLLAISALEIPRRIDLAPLAVAALDIALAGIVWLGFTASTLILVLFGPTEPIIANFAWILAISFVTAGLLLVSLAGEMGRS